jgi:hypothetical protein
MANKLREFIKVLLLLSIIFPFIVKDSALAQATIQWSEPENLTNTPTRSNHQYIVADDYGYVHLFWVEDVGGPEIGPDEEGSTGNTIFYRRWDGQRWSFPVDIFFSRGLSYSYPSAAVDDAGNMYLAWMAFNGLHFSSVRAEQAGSAKNWQNDSVIAPVQGYRAAILAQGDGELDILYSAYYQVADLSKDGNIYHIHSSDGGLTWSTPAQLTDIETASETLAVFPILKRDGLGRLHAAWYTTDPPGYTGTAVFYSRSTDDGESWSSPLKLDEVTPDKAWAAAVNIGVIGDNEVHLVWVCGKLPGRCHQYSRDGGETWTQPRTLFGDLVSLANWDAMETDADGNLYWIMQLRYPEALYYSYWTGESWIDPPLVVHSRDPAVSRGHGIQLAVRNGNELNMVFHHPQIFEIWHIWGVSPLAAPVAPQPTPTPLITPLPTLIPDLQSSNPSMVNLPVQTFDGKDEPARVARPDFSMMIGIAAAIFLIGAVVVFKFTARRP